jgi:N-acetylmuramoyl-L-alanine amidase
MTEKFTVVLDAGHGGTTLVEGSTPNNVVSPNGLFEKDLTLKIAKAVSSKLPAGNFKTILTRTDDRNLSLSERAKKSREHGADAFISIHFNGNKKPDYDGTEVFVSESSDEKDLALANELLKNVANAATIRKRGIQTVDFTVLKGKYRIAKTAACLIEMAYLTNPQQSKKLLSEKYLDELAAAVAKSVVNYSKQAAYSQSFAEQNNQEKLVAEVVKEHEEKFKFAVELPKISKETDVITFEIPNGLKMSYWEVEVLATSTGAGYKVIKFPPPKSEGKQSIHIEWNHLPYGKINYKFKAYASPDGIATPKKIYFNSSRWLEKSKDQITQGVPLSLAVKGEKAKQIYRAIQKHQAKQTDKAQQSSYEDYSTAMEPITITVVVLVGLVIFGILVVLGMLTLGAIIKMALDKGYNVKDTKYKAGVGEGATRQDHEIAFNITKPENQTRSSAKSFTFGLDDDLDSQHFESLNSTSLTASPKFDIKESVGKTGANKEVDVLTVKNRLIELGFNWLKADSKVNSLTITTIKLFQSIIKGSNSVVGDGLISVGKTTHLWLQAGNAPRWQTMSAGSTAEGYVNYELTDTKDTHDFGTDWLDETIKKAAEYYRDNYLKDNPKAALLTVNDVSLEHGGDTPDHSGHECGLACDLQLPRTDGTSGNITYNDTKLYDQNAARGILQALDAQSNVSTIYFNDSVLIKEKLCRSAKGHDNHIHFEILPPAIGATETVESKSQSLFAYSADAESTPLPTDCNSLKVKKLFLDYTGQKSNGKQIKFGLVWNNQPKECEAIDVVVHFHGWNTEKKISSFDEFKKYVNNINNIQTKEDYIKNEKDFFKYAVNISGLDLSSRNKTTIGIIPFGFASQKPDLRISYSFDYLTNNTSALQKFIDFVLNEFAKCHNLKKLNQNRLILTAHSGGGSPVSLILPNLGNKVDEVHIFDAIYGKNQADAMADWAKKKVATNSGALRAVYEGTPDTETISKNWGKIPTALSGFYKVEKTACNHSHIPKKFGPLLLEKADAALNVDQCDPKQNPKTPTTKQESLAFYDENEVDYFADREANFRDF